jgi:hypothetical protein
MADEAFLLRSYLLFPLPPAAQVYNAHHEEGYASSCLDGEAFEHSDPEIKQPSNYAQDSDNQIPKSSLFHSVMSPSKFRIWRCLF